MEQTAKKKTSVVSPRNVIFLLFGLLIVATGTSAYLFMKMNANPAKDAEADLKKTIALVSRHMVLPVQDTPTLATVSDPEKLRDQAFFANAKKGDKVLIYSSSRKAILYDPVADRIVEVAPINLTGTTEGQ